MGMIRPINQSALRSVLTPALGSARRGVSRYFTPLYEVPRSHINIISDITLDSSQEWVLSFSCVPTEPVSSNGFRVFDSPSGDFFKIFNADDASSPNLIRVRQNGGTANFDNAMDGIDRSSLNKFRIHNDGAGALSLFINDVFIDSKGAFNSFSFKLIGRGEDFFDDATDVICDIRAWTAGDESTGFIQVYYPINRYYTPQNNIVLDESGNGNNGTFVNVAAGDSKYYQQRADGNFVDLQGNVLEVAY